MSRAVLVLAVALLAALTVPAVVSPAPAHAAVNGWLEAVNTYRTGAGLAPVTENVTWSQGIAKHLDYLRLTPPSYFVGQYQNKHYENPASPYYTPEGAAAGESSDLAFGEPSDVAAIDRWMQAPFHAIGILRPGLTQVGFSRDAAGNAGLDIIRGLTFASSTGPVLFPGPGAGTHLTSFGGEVPDPLETCGWSRPAGLPLIALLPLKPPVGTTATLARSGGPNLEVCVVDEHTYVSSDAVYGPTGRAILQGDRAVLVIPRQPLALGQYAASINQPGRAAIEWSFFVASEPGPPTGVTAAAGVGQATVAWTAPASNGGAPITGYKVTATPGGHTCTTTGAHSCTVTGLTSLATYTFTVVASNGVGPSPPSNPSNPVLVPGPPGPPTSVAATPGNGLATVSWEAPVSNGGLAITAYTVTASPGGATCAWASGPLSCTIPGLSNGVAHTFTVVATNALGPGPPSVASATPSPGRSFHPLAPTRILDSRGSNGGWNGPLVAGSPRTLTVTGGAAAIPVGVDAVVLNVTVTGGTANSFVTAYPAGGVVPNASNLNFAAGQTIPNAVTVKVGAGGAVSFNNAVGSVHVVADVVGYFDAGAGDRYNPVSPVRILDSRGATGGWGAPLAASAPKVLTVTGGAAGIPSDVSAVVMNVTVTGASANSFLTVFPAGSAPPNASNLNFATGQTTPNLVTVKVGTAGAVAFNNAAGSVHVIVDVVGYFRATTGDLFHALAPNRILDSRGPRGGWSAKLPAGSSRPLSVIGHLPADATAVTANTTVTAATLNSFLTVFPAGTAAPNASNLNFAAGETVPNLVTSKIGPGGQVAFVNAVGATDVIFDVVGYYSPT